jgi:hypothetical protein
MFTHGQIPLQSTNPINGVSKQKRLQFQGNLLCGKELARRRHMHEVHIVDVDQDEDGLHKGELELDAVHHGVCA